MTISSDYYTKYDELIASLQALMPSGTTTYNDNIQSDIENFPALLVMESPAQQAFVTTANKRSHILEFRYVIAFIVKVEDYTNYITARKTVLDTFENITTIIKFDRVERLDHYIENKQVTGFVTEVIINR